MKTCTRMRQNVWTLAALAIGMSATIIPAAPAQESGAAPAGEEQPYIAVVTGADVYIRCGASESYYPFAKADEGDLVKITGRTVTMTTKVDQAIIGGVVTRIGSTVYDGSIATQLAKVRHRLSERS